MTLLMGDAGHDNVPALAKIGYQLSSVLEYVTGTPDVLWTPADAALFPGIPHMTCDQGYGTPVPDAVIRDVEPLAWTPAGAVGNLPWTAPNKTIYCNRNDLPAVLAAGWKGNLGLAIPGWTVGDTLPSAPGCNIVFVQNQLDVANAYDLSVILDDSWLYGGLTMKILNVDQTTVPAGTQWPGVWLLKGDGTISHIATPQQLAAYTAAGLPSATISYDNWTALAGVAS